VKWNLRERYNLVSEVGFMMDDQTLHLLIGHFRELKADRT
jgi:hypothetical protein